MERKKYRNGMIFSAILIAVGLFVVFYAIPNEVAAKSPWMGAASRYNAQTMPYLAMYIMIIASTLELIVNTRRFLKAEKKQTADEGAGKWKDEIRVALMFVLCIAYAILFDHAGFLIASAVVAPLALLLVKDKNWKHYLSVYVVLVITYILFRYVLRINI